MNDEISQKCKKGMKMLEKERRKKKGRKKIIDSPVISRRGVEGGQEYAEQI